MCRNWIKCVNRMQSSAQVIVAGSNQGGVRVVVGGLRGQGRGVKSGAFLEAPRLSWCLRRCFQGSETTSQQQEQQELHPPTHLHYHHRHLPSISLPQHLFWVPHKRLVVRWGEWGHSRLDGSRERHGILMGVERAGEERRWWGWMEGAHTQAHTYTQVQQHHCRGLFIWMIALN